MLLICPRLAKGAVLADGSGGEAAGIFSALSAAALDIVAKDAERGRVPHSMDVPKPELVKILRDAKAELLSER